MGGRIGKFNEYEIVESQVNFFMSRRNGDEFVGHIDYNKLEQLIKFGHRWYPKWHRDAKKFYIHCTFYIRDTDGKRKAKNIMLHQYLLSADSKTVDHINNNPLDNRLENLRMSETIKNTKNRGAKNSNNKSGYRNVCWIDGRWIVQLQVEGKNTRLGSFKDVHEAGAYAEEMRKKYYGDYAGKS